jgi:hypothetical protein
VTGYEKINNEEESVEKKNCKLIGEYMGEWEVCRLPPLSMLSTHTRFQAKTLKN